MKLGVFTPVFGGLDVRRDAGEGAARCGTSRRSSSARACWPGHDHLGPRRRCSTSAGAASDYRQMVEDAGLTISALSCHGNPLHPDPAIAATADDVFRRTVRLAEQLQVPVGGHVLGLPRRRRRRAASQLGHDAWPPEFLDVLDWQWEKKAIPYWRDAARFAGDHGVKVAHRGPSRLSRLQRRDRAAAAGGSRGSRSASTSTRAICSGRAWTCPAAIRALGDAIFHVHAKDLAFDRSNRAVNGVIDAKSYTPHGRAVLAVSQRRLGPRRAGVEADRQRAAARRLRLRDQHRARGRAGVG